MPRVSQRSPGEYRLINGPLLLHDTPFSSQHSSCLEAAIAPALGSAGRPNCLSSRQRFCIN